ncbi:hypothetical protein Hanom_Chr06g00570691 [Helianthus anomalus]
MFCIFLKLFIIQYKALNKQLYFIQHKVVQRGRNVILHSHSEVKPNSTLLVQHLLVQSLLTIQTSYSFSTYSFRCCQTAP